MKNLKLLMGCTLLLGTQLFSQYLEGGKKDYGIFTPNQGDWFFTQRILNQPLNRDSYNNKVYHITRKMEYDINNDGVKDAGDYAIKIDNYTRYQSSDLLLMTVLGVKDYKGTEVEIYTDCPECIVFYKNGLQKNFNDLNFFKRYSKVITTNGENVRTITSLPLLAQIPGYMNRRKFTIEVGMKIKVAKKVSCSSNEYSDYQIFPVNDENKHRGLTSNDSYFLESLGNCHFSRVKTPHTIKTPLINWGKEYELDRFITVHTIEY